MIPPAPLDAPLPAELTGRHQGWLTRYRRYPVFSAPWVRGRGRVSALGLGLVLAGLVLTVLAGGPGDRPWPGLVELMLTLAVPAAVGPWLGLWVRRRGWPERREWWALVGAMLLVTGAQLLFSALAAEPLKQFVAERIGAVDAQGKRKRVAMTIGVSIGTPEGRMASPGGPRDPATDPLVKAINVALRAGVAFVLAGGLALRGWQQQRSGLAMLARERALADAQAQRREAELRLSVLAAQVEPHFLFNTLAGVRSAIATDPARASEMIDRLVEYLRAAIPRLRSDGSAQATVGAQFEIVRAYLGLMSARMPRLAFAIDAEPGLLPARCPPLMLISLAENAVKHGVEMKIGPARITVRAERETGGRLRLSVEDDGAGFGAGQAGSGLGLANIRERLAQLYGDAASLTLKARPEGGVAAIICVPLELEPSR